MKDQARDNAKDANKRMNAGGSIASRTWLADALMCRKALARIINIVCAHNCDDNLRLTIPNTPANLQIRRGIIPIYTSN